MKYWILVIVLIVAIITWLHVSTPDLIGTYDTYWHTQYSAQNIENFGLKGLFVNPLEYTGFGFQFFIALLNLIAPPLIASKMAGIILSATVFILVGLMMQHLKVKAVWFWLVLLFLGSPSFSLRLIFVRTYLLSIILLLIGLFALITRRKELLGVTAVVYGLSYIAAPILIFMSLMWVAFNWYLNKVRNFQLFYIATIGVLVGCILNPAFPGTYGNLIRNALPTIGWLHTLETELGGYPFMTLLSFEFPLLVVWLSSLFISAKQIRKNNVNSVELFLQFIALTAFAGMIFAQRFIEYWAPLAVLSASLVYIPVLSKFNWLNLSSSLRRFWEVRLATALVIILATFFGWYGFSFILNSARPGDSVTEFRNIGTWLQNQAPPGSIVFNVNWLEYPKLYFWNPNSNYLIKIGGHVLYFDDPELNEYWSKIGYDLVAEMEPRELHHIIKYRATADYIVFRNKGNEILLSKLKENPQYFTVRYSDGHSSLYEINTKDYLQ